MPAAKCRYTNISPGDGGVIFVTVHLERSRLYQRVQFLATPFQLIEATSFRAINRKKVASFCLCFFPSWSRQPRARGNRLTGGGEDKIMEIGLTGI